MRESYVKQNGGRPARTSIHSFPPVSTHILSRGVPTQANAHMYAQTDYMQDKTEQDFFLSAVNICLLGSSNENF